MVLSFTGLTAWPDWLIVLILAVTMLLSLRLSYWIGGNIWWERHSIPVHGFGKEKRISGFWGEAVIVTLGTCFLLCVGALTPSVNLSGIILACPAWFWGVLGVCIALYAYYAYTVVADSRRNEAHRGKAHHTQLAWTYLAYGPYSVSLYLGVIAALLLLGLQYLADAAAIAEERGQIIAQLHAMNALTAGHVDPAKIQAGIEVAYGNILENGSMVAASMNPVFVLIALATSIMFLVTRSPIRQVLLGLPRSLAQYMGFMALIAFFLLTTVTYYFSYAALANESLRCISHLGPVLEHANADWEIMRRFNEIVIDLGRKHSFVGFAATVIDESGAAVVWMALLQWITSRNPAPVLKVKE
jgi:hypothetical protein